MIRKFSLYIGLLGSMLALFSCKTDEEVTTFVNTNLTDTTGVNAVADLFASGKLDGNEFEFFNGKDEIVNQPSISENGFCDSVGNYPSHIQLQTTVFHNPSELKNSIQIDIVDCITRDTNFVENLTDMLRVRQMPILNLADSAVGGQVKYYDEDGVLWSTTLGDNSGAGNNFQISAVIENTADSASKNVLFGTFSCDLYNLEGDIIKLRGGAFKARFGTKF